ncbi:MTH865 family protein [Methanolobus psychrotolerans]|uniref:MTH865 family protein n=1 Tax=Methanolobus psychrotolerans TaxID=1874706 RepID=UPI000B91C485|nr:MTH865 family protein [Methanolobus psychrotolerans]
MSIKEDIHSQIISGLANATFPIETPEKLLASFPAGAETTCKSGDVSVTAGEAGTLLKESDFPFKSAKEVADIIVERAGL